MNIGVSKKNALELLARRLNIRREIVISRMGSCRSPI
ncbi:hypothetical protein H0A61_00220 [Koleobacter methoxysyntrophicus]|uniref:Uncharacterized protein n=1 Tax=Koleobacter methoxysyntrophicus TaxID=2751313 RepID=A0A8A0RI66_9FIRM|nr:hypothetical protein [Bacillota bacterium]QSQ07903.1 hypothetical protein H0A61_00220 [Koleobacter methoxysyntrophicus]